jgi:hypothetical protein
MADTPDATFRRTESCSLYNRLDLESSHATQFKRIPRAWQPAKGNARGLLRSFQATRSTKVATRRHRLPPLLEGIRMLGDELRRPTNSLVARWPQVRRALAYLIVCSLMLVTLRHLPYLMPQITLIAIVIWAIAEWHQRRDL